MSLSRYRRLSTDQIGLPLYEVRCAWCRRNTARCRVDSGDAICLDCLEMAAEMGNGVMDVSCARGVQGTQHSGAWDAVYWPLYTFEPPLRFRLSIEHDTQDAGCWIRADLADEESAQLLGLGSDKEEEFDTITGGDRQTLAACFVCWLHEHITWCHDQLAQAPEDDPEDRAWQSETQRQARAALDWCAQHVQVEP